VITFSAAIGEFGKLPEPPQGLVLPPPQLTFFDRFSTVSFKLFGGQAVKVVGSMPLLRQDLLKSNLRITPEGLISVALFSTFISAVVVAGIAVIAVVRSFPLLLFATPAPVVVLILVLNGPKISQSSRSSRLDDELPFMIGYMSILSGGGLPLMSIIRISEMKIFPAAGSEAKRILVDVDYYGYDPISALERAAKYNPNKTFAELLSGYTTVVSTGGTT
jgi:archaeal flagellar protein FlaJ